VTLEDAASLRERATRSRRLAFDTTDHGARTDLMAYALELEDRARRMDASQERNSTKSNVSASTEDGAKETRGA
jgi:hypothetical protein